MMGDVVQSILENVVPELQLLGGTAVAFSNNPVSGSPTQGLFGGAGQPPLWDLIFL